MKIQSSGKPLCRFSYTNQGKTLYYNITSDSTVEVTYYSSDAIFNAYVNGDVVIPSSVEYNGTKYSVTSIGEGAFRGCRGLTSVTIPNSVTSIGEGAFYDCSGLTSVTIPNSVTSIGEYAFWGCSGLTSVIIPNSVTSIGDCAFLGCSGLTSVTIPTGVTSIGKGAFSGCSSLTSINVASGNTHYSSIDGVLYNYVQDTLIQCPGAKTSVTIPNSVTSIGEYAFSGCSGLTSVTIPTGVTSIGRSAFYNCSGLTTLNFNARNCQDFSPLYYSNNYPFSGTSLTTVNIGDSVQRIPKNFVKGCSGLTTLNFNAINCQDFGAYRENGNYYYPFSGTSLTTVNIGDSVQRIPANFVSDCSRLTSVTIGNSVTSIGGSAFDGCSSLTSVTIPTGVTSIGERAFSGCSGLTMLNFNAINCQDFEAYCDYYNGTYCSYYPFSGTSLTTVNIGDSVQRIPKNFVRDCSGLTSVTIGTGVTSIGERAFSGCSSLTSVTIPTGVTSIGERAFCGCSGLTSVTIPNSVTSIGERAFCGCSGLTSVIIPNSVTSIGDRAFSGCSDLTSINVASGNTHYSSIDGVLYNSVQDTLIQCPGAKTSVTIPNSVTSIGEYAFSGCSGLTSVTIPTGVTSIGRRAFSGCSELTSINVASGNTHYSSIDGVLYNYVQDTLIRCPSAKTSVTIPNSVTSIGSLAFSGCSGLTSITIPNSVTSIGESAFSGCSSLTSVTIGNSVTSIGEGAFWRCSGLTSVTIPTGVTSIGNGAFSRCRGLISVTIPNSVTSIGKSAFSDCSHLTSISIPNSVTSIGNSAFSGCSGLTSVTIPNSVTSIGEQAFSGCSGLTSVTIPNSVTSIGEGAFSGCTGLMTLNFNAINCQDFSADSNMFGISLTTLTIGDSVQRIPANFVRYCNALTFVTIPNSVMEIGHDAFRNCGGLIAAILGNGVSNVGNNAFKDCSYLTYLTIGIRLERIDDSAFANCSLLTSITSLASVPPLIVSSNVFAYPNNCTVTVPCGSLEAYTEQTNRWNLLFNGRISEGLSFELSLSANDEAYGRVETDTLSCAGRTLIATPNEGYRFLSWNDGNTENPRTVTITSDTAFMAIFTETVSTPTITLTVNDETMGSASYTMDGNTAVLTATANEGYEFTGWNDGNTENPRTVTVTSDTAFMAIFTASGSSSLQEVNAREFAMYPNPAKRFVNLEFETLQENTLLQILDINGRRVRTVDLKAGIETLRIDLGDLPKGVYTITIGNATKKLIVE